MEFRSSCKHFTNWAIYLAPYICFHRVLKIFWLAIDLYQYLVIILKMVFIIWKQGFIFSKWVSVERNSSIFFFLALDLISGLDSFVKMEAYCYLGESTEGEKSQNYELKGGCAVKLTARTVSPGASIARTIFVVSFCEPWSGEFILWRCVPIAARKKKKMGGRLVQQCISWWQLYAVVWCCRALCGISTLSSFESNHSVWLEKGGFRKEPISAKLKPYT